MGQPPGPSTPAPHLHGASSRAAGPYCAGEQGGCALWAAHAPQSRCLSGARWGGGGSVPRPRAERWLGDAMALEGRSPTWGVGGSMRAQHSRAAGPLAPLPLRPRYRAPDSTRKRSGGWAGPCPCSARGCPRLARTGLARRCQCCQPIDPSIRRPTDPPTAPPGAPPAGGGAAARHTGRHACTPC